MGLARKLTSCILIMTVALNLSGCGPGKDKENVDNIDTSKYTVIIEEKDNLHCIEAVESAGIIKFNYLINGNVSETFEGDYNKVKALDMPEVDTLKSDISALGLIADNVYECDLYTGASYIKALENEGYKIVFEARTSKFIEVYVENTQDIQLKRIIITPEYMIISDVENIPGLKIEDYLFK